MCIISFRYRTHPTYPLIIAANRDEFYDRPASPLHHWEDAPITAGRDERQRGTWLGVNEAGRFVAITNYRDPKLEELGALSRGQIATSFLQSEDSSQQFAEKLQQARTQYGPFNVLLFDGDVLIHYNNIFNEMTIVPPGVHCVSNATLNTPWPKVQKLTEQVAAITEQPNFSEEALFKALADQTLAPDEQLPATGVPLQLERQLSSVFVQMTGYGTRCSTVITFDGKDFTMHEKTFEQGVYRSNSHTFVPRKKSML